MWKITGFTLIELLVVVLIIGILVSVAVPQYQKAVAKGRISNILTEARHLRQEFNLYYMANGKAPSSLSDVSGGWRESSLTNGQLLACFGNEEDHIHCWTQQSDYVRRYIKLPLSSAWQCDLSFHMHIKPFCYVYTDFGEQVAKSLGWEKKNASGSPQYYMPVGD